MSVTNLTGVYERLAQAASDEDVMRVLEGLRGEPEPRHPHITQALDAFTREASRRGLVIVHGGVTYLNEAAFFDDIQNSGLARDVAALLSRDDALEGLRELSERATKGRWRTFGGESVECIYSKEVDDIVHWTGFDASGRAGKLTTRDKANAALIVAAVNYVRTALAKTKAQTND